MKKIILASALLLLASFLITKLIQSIEPAKEETNQVQESQPEKKETSNQPLPINDITQNWQEYKNDQYGYKIKFPPDWKINQTYPNPNIPAHIVYSTLEETKRDDEPYAILGISIEPAKDRNLNGYYVIGDLVMDGYEKYSLEISNTQGALLITSDDNKDLANLVVLRDGLFYRLTWNATTRASRAKYEETFKQILATFKFTHRPKIDQNWI